MKVLMINGSPRKDGNTAAALVLSDNGPGKDAQNVCRCLGILEEELKTLL